MILYIQVQGQFSEQFVWKCTEKLLKKLQTRKLQEYSGLLSQVNHTRESHNEWICQFWNQYEGWIVWKHVETSTTNWWTDGWDHSYHDDAIKWKHFPHYWPFVRGIHHSPVNSPHKGQWCRALFFSFDVRLNQTLSKQWKRWWFEISSHSLWCHCNVPSANRQGRDKNISWHQPSHINSLWAKSFRGNINIYLHFM